MRRSVRRLLEAHRYSRHHALRFITSDWRQESSSMFEFPTCGSDTVAGPRSAKGSTAATENLVASPTMEEDQENQTSASNNAPMQLSPTPAVPQMADDRSSCTRTLVRRCADEKIVFNNYKDHDTMALEASSVSLFHPIPRTLQCTKGRTQILRHFNRYSSIKAVWEN